MNYRPILVLAALMACVVPLASAQSPAVNNHDFPRAASPWECARADGWMNRQFWRDKRPDTTYFPRAGMPRPASTVDAVRRCLAKFTVEGTAARDLPGLIEAYLAAEQFTEADAAAAKLASAVASAPVEQKAWALVQIVRVYTGAPIPQLDFHVYTGAPVPRLDRAKEYLAQLDALGAPAAVERMFAHKAMADAAQLRDSVPLWENSIRAALAATQEIEGDAAKESAPFATTVYRSLAELEARKGDGQGAIETVEAGRAELVPLLPALERDFNQMLRWFTPLGEPVEPVKATRWFNAAEDAVHPAPGQPALLVFVNHYCVLECYPGYAALKRLRAQYEPRGLDITLIAHTQGSYLYQLARPEDEMPWIAEYFSEHLDLPLPLAVVHNEWQRRNDGRMIGFPMFSQSALAFPGNARVVHLVDRTGKVRLVLELTRENEAILDNVIASMF